jgi:hypothetical protein
MGCWSGRPGSNRRRPAWEYEKGVAFIEFTGLTDATPMQNQADYVQICNGTATLTSLPNRGPPPKYPDANLLTLFVPTDQLRAAVIVNWQPLRNT